MCGRYTLSTPADLIRDQFDVEDLPDLAARYNIAPSQESLIIGIRSTGERRGGLASWGLTSSGAAASAPKRRLINARMETASEKRSFKIAYERRRCLVPADGFFEWQAGADGKMPIYFTLEDRRLFAFAGLWNPALAEGDPPTFAILTTRPNEVVSPVHDRMPVIVDETNYDIWLCRRPLSPAEHERLSVPYPPHRGKRMQSWPVSAIVNSPANDVPECLLPTGH